MVKLKGYFMKISLTFLLLSIFLMSPALADNDNDKGDTSDHSDTSSSHSHSDDNRGSNPSGYE